MTTSWLADAAKLISDGRPTLMVTVCSVEGSAPREVGARMIVTPTEQSGTIGGGNLEFSAIARAREILAGDQSEAVFEDYPLGPAFGQCCGGRVRLGYERLCAPDLGWLRQTIDLIESGRTAVLERRLSGTPDEPRPTRLLARRAPAEHLPAFAFLDVSGAALASSMAPIEDCAGLREAVADARARVFIFGAGHVGGAAAQILQAMPVKATLIDRRTDQLPTHLGARIEIVCSAQETEIARTAPAGACFLVMTHSHDIDYELVLEILKRGDSAYCGLIGSLTKRARFERRLRRAGLGDAQLGALICPIGANGLKSKLPASIALSAVHEMLLAHQRHETETKAWK